MSVGDYKCKTVSNGYVFTIHVHVYKQIVCIRASLLICEHTTFQRVPGADAGFRVRGGRKWRIQDTKSVGEGGVRFRSHIRKVGGCASGPIYEKCGGGGGGGGGALQVPYTKSGGGGHSASDTFGHTENIYMYLPTCY